MTGDLRGPDKTAKRDRCCQECQAELACMGVVFHPWGTMLKKSVTTGRISRTGFLLRIIIRAAVGGVGGGAGKADADAEDVTANQVAPTPSKPMVMDGSGGKPMVMDGSGGRRPQPPPTPSKPMVMDGSGGRRPQPPPTPSKPMVMDGSGGRRPQPPPTPYKPIRMDGSRGRPTITGLDGDEKKAEMAEKDRAAAVATTAEDKQKLHDAKEKEAKAKQGGDDAKTKDAKAETDAAADQVKKDEAAETKLDRVAKTAETNVLGLAKDALDANGDVLPPAHKVGDAEDAMKGVEDDKKIAESKEETDEKKAEKLADAAAKSGAGSRTGTKADVAGKKVETDDAKSKDEKAALEAAELKKNMAVELEVAHLASGSSSSSAELSSDSASASVSASASASASDSASASVSDSTSSTSTSTSASASDSSSASTTSSDSTSTSSSASGSASNDGSGGKAEDDPNEASGCSANRRKRATTGDAVWCKCNSGGSKIGGADGTDPAGPDRCVDVGGGRKDVCQWDSSTNVCVPSKKGQEQKAKETLRPGMVVAFKGGRDHKHCADEGGNGVICNRAWVRGWEMFTVVKATGGYFALRGGKDDKFCSWRDEKIKCDRSEVTSTEEFIIEFIHSGVAGAVTVTLKIPGRGADGVKFCADEEGGIKCNRAKEAPWERYTLVVINDGKSALGKLDEVKRKVETSQADKKKAELELAAAKHDEDIAADNVKKVESSASASGGGSNALQDAVKKKEDASEKVQGKISTVVHIDEKIDKLTTEGQAVVAAEKTKLGGGDSSDDTTGDDDGSDQEQTAALSAADGSSVPTGLGRGAYFCCAGEAALGGLSTLGDIMNDGFRIASMPYVKKAEEVFESNLPESISEEALFQSEDFTVDATRGKIALKQASEELQGDDTDSTVVFDLELPVIKDLCTQVRTTVAIEMPSTDSVPLVAAVQNAGAVDVASLGKIVEAAGGKDAAGSFCRSCGAGERLPELMVDVVKADGVALLARDCAKLAEGGGFDYLTASTSIHKLHVEVKFTEAGMAIRVVAGKDRLVVQGDIKSDKLNNMCVPVTYFPGALSILFCSKGGSLPDMVTKGANTIKNGRKAS